MTKTIQVKTGFTLVELLVALVAGMFLLGGVSVAYSSISSSKAAEREIENALDVLRFTSTVFSTSLKQTASLPTIAGSTLSVSQEANSQACTGEIKSVAYTEIYSVEDRFLYCDIGDGNVKLLKGIDSISFSLSDNVTTISVGIDDAPAQLSNAIIIDIALTRLIMNEVFGS